MSAPLSEPLFHGTKVDLQPGDMIRPRSHGTHENSNWSHNPAYGEETHNYAYATNDIEEAKFFGGHGGKIYEVEPVGKTRNRRLYKRRPKGAPESALNIREHLSKEGFKVKRLVK